MHSENEAASVLGSALELKYDRKCADSAAIAHPFMFCGSQIKHHRKYCAFFINERCGAAQGHTPPSGIYGACA